MKLDICRDCVTKIEAAITARGVEDVDLSRLVTRGCMICTTLPDSRHEEARKLFVQRFLEGFVVGASDPGAPRGNA